MSQQLRWGIKLGSVQTALLLEADVNKGEYCSLASSWAILAYPKPASGFRRGNLVDVITIAGAV